MLEEVVLKKLERIEGRYGEIEGLLADPAVASDRARYQALAKEHSDLSEVVAAFRDYRAVLRGIAEAQEIAEGVDDEEWIELARLEIRELEGRQEALSSRLKALLVPKDPADERNTIVEIRAGTGGEEAGLFAADLFRMYSRYAEEQGWRIEPLSASPTGLGGFKEVIFSVSGRGAYGKLKYESGVHRVQRVPATEASGRIHTSAASVAVLPEAEEVDVQIDPKDLRIDVCRSSGPGGQSVNTTDSAVRVTHLPTGITVHCQDEKSQHKNKAKALKILRARLLDIARREQQERIAQERRTMVRSGDRSDKSRTYNFPQNRVTDHRIDLTLYDLDRVIDGELNGIIETLRLADQAEKLAEVV